jgi:hypothetical protein
VWKEPDTPASGERQKSIADISGPVGDGEQLGRFRLFYELKPELALEKGDLFREGPRSEDLTESVGR